ncbi:MAG TPA: tetratricopeptide repeat protein, partial [Rhodocyclaceae bacterium]|nr:tetratricopeptide repeat protein [Rhodocyclaceae bacterium]
NPDGVKEADVVAFDEGGQSRILHGGCHQVAASPSGRWLASVGHDWLRIVDLQSGRPETWMQEKAYGGPGYAIGSVRTLTWDKGDVLLVVQGDWGVGVPFAVARYDMARKKTLPAIPLPESTITTASVLDKNLRRLWLGSDQGRLLEVDLEAGKVVSERSLGDGAIVALSLSEDRHLAAWVGDRILIADVKALDEAPRSLPAWPAEGGHGWSPLLAWGNDDLLLAARQQKSDQWLAQRVDKVIATLDDAPAERVKRFNKQRQGAEAGDPAAQFALGSMYYQGIGVEANLAQAMDWWRKAAEAGNLDAQLELGHFYWRGLDGVQRDKAAGQAWFLKAAEQYRGLAEKGDRSAAGRLGRMYELGLGVHQDSQLAAALMRIAVADKQEPKRDLYESRIQELERDLRPEQKARVAAVVAQWGSGQPLPIDLREVICGASPHRQANFDSASAQAAFRDFQQRMRKGIDALGTTEIPPGTEGREAALAKLRLVFGDVVDAGPKGDALLLSLLEPSSPRFISPMGVMLQGVVNTACPVGYGGTFNDGGRDVELWYVDFRFDGADVLKAFREAALPPFGSLERDAFPALVFVRDGQQRLKWYAISREMISILNRWANIQLQ